MGVAEDFFAKHDIHIHVPAGAIPKDGPSAGVTMLTALTSLLTNKPIRKDTGHDRRNHLAGPGAAGGRDQGKSTGRPSGGNQNHHHAQNGMKKTWKRFLKKLKKTSNFILLKR